LIFNSLSYILFLITTVIIYYLIPERFRWMVLIVTSIAYYLSFIPVFFAVIAFLAVANYFLAFWLQKSVEQRTKRSVFIAIISINLLILILFKYFH